MTTILKDLHGEPILWTDVDENGEAVICDERECTPLYGDDPATAAAEWIQTCSVDWASVTPCITIPGIAWCRYGDDVCLVERTGSGWRCRDGQTRPTWQAALAHEVRAYAEGDGEPFDVDATDDEVLAGRVVHA